MLQPSTTNEETFKALCYEIYKGDYVKSHYLTLIMQGIPVTDYDSFIEDCSYACYEEFLDTEYQDKEIMEEILNNDNLFTLYRFFTEGEDISSTEDGFSETNPMFISFVKLLDELCKREIVKKDTNNQNNVLIYRTGLDPALYSSKEGFVSENIFEVAEELFRDKESRESLYKALSEKYSITPVFTKDGDFDKFISVS